VSWLEKPKDRLEINCVYVHFYLVSELSTSELNGLGRWMMGRSHRDAVVQRRGLCRRGASSVDPQWFQVLQPGECL
jgi:hypothetical protein